jgi:serine/threonine-protein kinase
LKPANILLTSGGGGDGEARPKITDFGLAKKLDNRSSGQTAAGLVVGTPSYMSPEQAKGDLPGIGPATDIYGLGAILHACLTGAPPFTGETPLETAQQVIDAEPTPPSRLNPAVPRDLDTICLKCLSKSSSGRYPTAEALAEDLRRYLAGQPILARPTCLAERTWRWCRRNSAVVGVVVVVMLVMSCAFAWSTALWLRVERLQHQADAERAAIRRATEEDVAAIPEPTGLNGGGRTDRQECQAHQ